MQPEETSVRRCSICSDSNYFEAQELNASYSFPQWLKKKVTCHSVAGELNVRELQPRKQATYHQHHHNLC